MSNSDVEAYGWTAVPRDRSALPSEETCNTSSITVDFDAIWPTTDVVTKAAEWVKPRLPQETWNHCLRVYCYGHTILTQHLPDWIPSPSIQSSFLETWALTCLFHDIATTPTMRSATHLSFEFQGGMTALQQLQEMGAPKAQAESVCEAIIRHQDPGETGMISAMGCLVQVTTELDNIGSHPYLIPANTLSQISRQHPRMKWSSCFGATVAAEIAAKPWCHTTALPGFEGAVRGNEVMAPYE